MTEEARIHSGGKDSLLNKCAGKTGELHSKRMKVEHIPYAKNTSKWITNLNVRLIEKT